jgi:hypothetical protein
MRLAVVFLAADSQIERLICESAANHFYTGFWIKISRLEIHKI